MASALVNSQRGIFGRIYKNVKKLTGWPVNLTDPYKMGIKAKEKTKVGIKFNYEN